MALALSCLAGAEPPVGSISDLRVIDTVGKRIRLAWTGVPGATEYKIVLRSSQGESPAGSQCLGATGELWLQAGLQTHPELTLWSATYLLTGI